MMPASRRLTACVLERGPDEEIMMKIDGTVFGAITIDGKAYGHDVVVRLSGEVVKRKKKFKEALWYVARTFRRRGKISLREGVRPGRHWLGSVRQRAPVAGS